MLLIMFTFIGGISCSDTKPKTSLTDSLNKIINGFFDSIRETRKVKDYGNITLSWKGLSEVSNTSIGFLVLLAVGSFYVAFVVISGLSFIICRFRGRCGNKPPAIDHSKATNKLAVFGVLLLILVLCQIFGAFMIQSNNLVIYRKLRSKDKEENWFQSFVAVLKEFSQSMDNLLQKISSSNVHSNYSKLADESIKKCKKKIKTGLEDIVERLLKNQDINELISKAKVAKKTLEDLPKSFIGDQKKKYNIVTKKMANLKNSIAETRRKVKTFTCGNDRCRYNVKLYFNLNFMKDKKLKDILEKYYKFLSDDQISKELDDVINIKIRGDSFIKKVRTKTEENLKMLSKQFLNLIKQKFNGLLNTTNRTVHTFISYLDPSTTMGNTKQKIFLYDSYRYFGWLTIFLVVILISFIFLIGFLFGVVGKGDERENRCSKKIVGSRILMVGIGMSYFLAPFLMVIVVVSMTSLGSIQSEVCQYTVPDSKIGPAILDSYLNALLQNNQYANYDNMDLLMVKCKTKSIFESALKLTTKSMIKNVQNYAYATKLNYNFDKTFNKYSKIEEMKKYVNVLRKNIETDIRSYVILLKYFYDVQIIDELHFQNKELKSMYDKLSSILNDTNPLNTDLLQSNKTYKILLGNLDDMKQKTYGQILKVMMKNVVTMIQTLITSGLEDLKCNDVHEKFLSIFEFVCRDTLSYLNGSWYGLGLFLILLVPTVIVALFVEMLFRQLQDIQEVKLNLKEKMLSVSEATGIKSIPGNTHIAEGNALIGIDFNFSQSDATELKTVVNENVIAEDNELSGNEVNDIENKPNTSNYKRFSAIYQLRDKALQLKNLVQFRIKQIKNILKSEVTNESDVENNQEFTVHFNDLTKKEKNNCYESDIHSLRNYPFKITMFIENDENIVFYLVALNDENVDSLEWPLPFSMTMMAKNHMGVILWTMAAESNQSGHNCDIDTSKGLYSCDVVTQLSNLGNECFITVKVV